ncbi:hypothetical protein CEUSTIGMA_g52.t1 [Chlamydomonas eustigma]|uniref:Armadillo repeat-containing domain-containing protein n=1 Tax=Chlamydomonas eustigma TaxID=1157962 RepID=A0A250WPH4_9CHLO|nr:hypothetical protein CEUSTIGMA_g52.t1 [Chlamydomonas eustigma]|eukprot:GAX72596.1 hypothetical protein CEUSTIGMA_g52.t1 [Chlamydomonas eustigma]
MPSNLTAVAEVGGSLKQVQQAFQAYQVARNQFVNSISGFLERKDTGNVIMEALMKNDVMAVLCCPLAQDPIPGIQSLSLSCLGKLSAADPLLSQVVVSCGVLDSVVTSLSHESPPVQTAADSVLSSVARNSSEFAHRIMTSGALPALLYQLHSSSTPPSVKEGAVRALDSLIRSSVEHANVICNGELLSTLVALMLNPGSPHTLCKAIVGALGNIAACSPKLAEAVVQQKALDPLTRMVRGTLTPPDLKAAALNCLSQLCVHHEELANQVANTGVVQSTVQALTDKMTPSIRRNAAALLLQMVQKTPELAAVVSSTGAPGCLKQFMVLEQGHIEGTLTGLMIAGSMSSYNMTIAKAIVESGAGAEVVAAISNTDASISGTAAWAVEQAIHHSDETAMPLIQQGALQQLMSTYIRSKQSEALRSKLKSSIKATIRSCNATGPLETFVAKETPPELSKHLLARLVTLLQVGPKARQQLVTSGALARLQEALPGLDPKGRQHAEAIQALFPPDVVAYYAQGKQ